MSSKGNLTSTQYPCYVKRRFIAPYRLAVGILCKKEAENMFANYKPYGSEEVEAVEAERRKGKIALAIFRDRVLKEGVPATEALERELGDVSNTTGIPKEELRKFYDDEYHLSLDKMLSIVNSSIRCSVKKIRGALSL